MRGTTTGIDHRLLGLLGRAVLLVPGLAMLMLLARPVQAAEEYALIAGTVFRASGHAFPGVEVTLQPEQGKVQKTRSSPRGEFTFRVPPKAGRYTVSVKAAGHRSESKPVEVQADERVDLSFLMESDK
ncbi:MAG: carboxypeptidase-like regulatory domain-containing protein [Acidobacteria bacterium]|nr:carboxypeptidase-like regulatory domain-containing protein [Acidobacteriota bacterium]